MIVIFWSPLGFPVIQALPPNVTFTSEFFVDAISPLIVAAKPASDPGRRLVLHMDNVSPHRARLTARNPEENRIATSPHLAFSPDVTLSDLCLFGALKGHFSGRIYESLDRLVATIREIASTIARATFERVFLK
jgi:hypothetical protein